MLSIRNHGQMVEKHIILSISGKVAAINCDNSPDALEKKKSRVLILSCDGKMHHIQQTKQEPEVEFELI